MLGLELRVDYQQSNFPLVGVLETRLPNEINSSVCAPKYEAIQNKHISVFATLPMAYGLQANKPRPVM